MTAVRAELEASAQIEQSDQLLGDDGRWYTNKRKAPTEPKAPRSEDPRREIITPKPVGELRIDPSLPDGQGADAEREKELFVATTRPLIDGLIAESREDAGAMMTT